MPTVDTLDIQISAGAEKAEKALTNLTNKLDTLSGGLKKVSGFSGMSGLTNGIKQTSASFKDTSTSGSKLVKTSNSLTSSFMKLRAVSMTLTRVFSQLGKSIKSSMDYIETLNYFNNAWAQVAENADLSAFEELGYKSADAYANSFSERAKQVTSQLTGFNVMPDGSLIESGQASLGIDPNQVMNYQAMFGQMSSSIGITAENSLLLSEALTKIGADLASVKNMDFDKVWKDMASGLAGMSRTLDKYGVNIRNVNLQQKLWDLGINENIANLNQNDKALLRTIILLESTGYAYGDLAETINAPANQLRLLKANFSNLARTIGNLFLPVIQTVLPYINGLVIALQRLFTWIGSLLGLDFSDLTSSVSSVGGADFGDLIGDTDDLEDSLDKASKSAKKLKDYTLGIDELNIIKPQEEESGGAGSLSGGAGGLLNDAFLDAVNKYLDEWDKAFAEVENKANEIADKIQEFALKVWKFIQPFIEALMRFWTSFQKVIDFVITAFEDFYENFLKPLLEWAFGTEDKGLTAFVNTLTDLVNKIDWEKLNKALKDLWIALEPFVEKVGDGLNWFFREVLSPLAEFLINSVLIDSIEALADAFEILNDVIDVLTPIAKEFWEQFGKEAYADILERIAIAVDSLLNPFESLKELLDDFSWDNFLKYAKDVADFALLLTNPMAFFATKKKNKENQNIHSSANGNEYGGGGNVRGYSGSLADTLENFKISFNQFFEDIGESATEFFDDLYANKLKEFVTNTSKKFGEWKQSISDKIDEVKKSISEKWENIKTNTQEFLSSIGTSISEKWQEIKDGISEKIENIRIKISQTWENIKLKTVEKFTEIRDNIQTIWTNIKNYISDKLDAIKTSISGTWEEAKKTVGGIVKGIYDNISEKFTAIQTSVENTMSAASTAMDNFKTAISNAITKITEFFGWNDSEFKITLPTKGFETLAGKIKDVIDKIKEFFGWDDKEFEIKLPTDIFEGFAGKVKDAIDRLKEFFDFDGKSVSVSSNVSGGGHARSYDGGYATGGFPQKYSLFMAGENGIPEIAGTVGGRTAVAGGAEITGIRDAVYSTGQAETALLQTAVQLLQIIADKDPSINVDGRSLVSAYDERKIRNGYAF